jgi:hypothetical protein
LKRKLIEATFFILCLPRGRSRSKIGVIFNIIPYINKSTVAKQTFVAQELALHAPKQAENKQKYFRLRLAGAQHASDTPAGKGTR